MTASINIHRIRQDAKRYQFKTDFVERKIETRVGYETIRYHTTELNLLAHGPDQAIARFRDWYGMDKFFEMVVL